MSQPFEIYNITKIDELFGRKKLVDAVIRSVKMRNNIAIIGARRFGKTSLVNCVINQIKDDDSLKVYPIYFDFKQGNIKRTKDAYVYMISLLVENLYNDKYFTDEESFAGISIKPSEDWLDIAEQLEKVSEARVNTLFKKIILFFSELLEKTILFCIDEYEYLFKYVLETPAGFNSIRNISVEKSEKSHSRPFNFWIIGAVEWDELCDDIGSGECNTVTVTYYVTPISKEDFTDMWKYECEKITDNALRTEVLNCVDRAFEHSGGVPFYGKCIGADYISKRKYPDYRILQSHFGELISKTYKGGKYKILGKIASGQQNILRTTNLNRLADLGLIGERKNQYFIVSSFLQDYLKSEYIIEDSENAERIYVDEITELVDEKITGLIETIVKTRKNKGKAEIFRVPSDSGSTYKELRTICNSSEQYVDFASALYRIYFEWTKKDKTRDLLPDEFKESEFSKCVDVARHTLGKGHVEDFLISSKKQINKAEMLKIMTGTDNEPYDPEDFRKLQKAFLIKFKEELERMLRYIKNE